MCDPSSMMMLGGAMTIMGGTVRAGTSFAARRTAKNVAKKNARMERVAILNNLQAQGEAAADESFQLARAALEARGKVQASGLGARSTKALARAVGFEAGQDQATINKNFQTANEIAHAQLLGVDARLEAARAQIGDTSGATLGLGILGSVASGAVQIGAGMERARVDSLQSPSSGDVSPLGDRVRSTSAGHRARLRRN